MNWIIPGLLYAFFNALVTFTNEKYTMNSAALGMWRGFGSVLVALPFVFFIAPPSDVWFWVFAAVQGIMVGFFDFKLFSASAKFGAGGASMMLVLSIILSIVLWWAIDYHRLLALLHDPKVFIPILIALAGALTGYTHLTGGSMNKDLLKYMAPAIVTLSLMTLNAKNIVERAPILEAVLYYMVVIGGVGGLFNAVLYRTAATDKSWAAFKAAAFSKNALHGGLLILGSSVLLMVSKNFSMEHIPNPGYLNALALTTPLWILFLNRFLHIRTRVSVKATLFTLVCVAVLVYFANIPLAAVPY